MAHGTRLYAIANDWSDLIDGAYCKLADGRWVLHPPGGPVDVVSPVDHCITEHPDGEITVIPAIHADGPHSWHGFLEHGEWYGFIEQRHWQTITAKTLLVEYSCVVCGIRRASVAVPARVAETDSVMRWLQETITRVSTEHRRRSPLCLTLLIEDISLPIGSRWLGGPVS